MGKLMMQSTLPMHITVTEPNRLEDILHAVKYHAFRKGELHKRLNEIKAILKDVELESDQYGRE